MTHKVCIHQHLIFQCFSHLTYVMGNSRYLIGQNDYVTSFQSAMDKCISLGAHSVHINTEEEHDMIKEYIRSSGDHMYFS